VIVLVVAKAPVPGQVKTRLCPPATPRQAATVAAAALLDTLDAVRATPGVTPVLAHTGTLSGAERAGEIRSALAGWHRVPQRGATFADRLARAHADAAAHAPGRPVLQIGMDTPQVSPATLASTMEHLDTAEAVLGPALDGGWWALGLRNPHQAEALRGVPMSTSETRRLTHEALITRGLHIIDGLSLSDVDSWDDAQAVAAAAPGGRVAAAVAGLNAGAAR
jgi:glycosyltransferase A (GT-A) superfamily protein (DUF2064 family)